MSRKTKNSSRQELESFITWLLILLWGSEPEGSAWKRNLLFWLESTHPRWELQTRETVLDVPCFSALPDFFISELLVKTIISSSINPSICESYLVIWCFVLDHWSRQVWDVKKSHDFKKLSSVVAFYTVIVNQ